MNTDAFNRKSWRLLFELLQMLHVLYFPPEYLSSNLTYHALDNVLTYNWPTQDVKKIANKVK